MKEPIYHFIAREGPVKFGQIENECRTKLGFTGSFRLIDRYLQRLRKAGQIIYTPGGWVVRRSRP